MPANKVPGLVWCKIPAGTFVMGSDAHGHHGAETDDETPAHKLKMSGFEISATTITNRQFQAFVRATSYKTDAEKFGWSFVFGGLLPDDFPDTCGVASAPWWRQVYGADWQHPFGPQSNLKGLLSHPVVHVSHNDALAFCQWANCHLPTEAQWEYAARGGLEQQQYPWGNDLQPGGKHQMNTWQGKFPAKNTQADGHYGTAPAKSYQPNAYGLYNATGNVWEWCADWYQPDHYAHSPVTNPTGPKTGTRKITRGGSFLCHASYCARYRVNARNSNEPDSSASNVGFRVVGGY